eukprot:13550564-Ditylum_brightwellii.AAC.1
MQSNLGKMKSFTNRLERKKSILWEKGKVMYWSSFRFCSISDEPGGVGRRIDKILNGLVQL